MLVRVNGAAESLREIVNQNVKLLLALLINVRS
jgi:hypothetical protein